MTNARMSKPKLPAQWPPAQVKQLQRRLHRWYARRKRDLPWRRVRDPYAIWVSEVMLQQTRAETVIGYFQRFMEHFPTVHVLAAADLQQVLSLWQGLGYYGRARNLHRAAGQVVRDYGGQMPDTVDGLRVLAGVGDYIAAAVASIAFGRPAAVADGNVKRVLARLMQLDWPVNRPADHRRFRQVAQGLLDRRRPGDHNQAMMELGAMVCKPTAPACDACPLAQMCAGRAAGTIAAFPRRLSRGLVPLRRTVAVAVTAGERLLLVRRPLEGLLGGMWELPGTAAGDNALEAGARLVAEMGLEAGPLKAAGQVRHVYSHFRLQMQVFSTCCLQPVQPAGKMADEAAWVTAKQLAAYPVHRAAAKAIEAAGFIAA